MPIWSVMRERRGYVILALMSIGLSVAVLLISINTDKATAQKFCQVIALHLKEPVIKPPFPKNTPNLQLQWELHLRRIALAKELGCIK